MTHILLLVIGFILVLAGADLLVKRASSLGKRLRVSDLVVGLTVVAFGTSMPELFVNIIASIRGSSDIALGNIVGSNISNILFILGVSAIIFPLAATKGTVWREIPLSLLAAILVGVLGNDRLIDTACLSALTRVDELVLLCFFVIFAYYSIGIARNIEGIDKHMPEAKHRLARISLQKKSGDRDRQYCRFEHLQYLFHFGRQLNRQANSSAGQGQRRCHCPDRCKAGAFPVHINRQKRYTG